MGPSTFVLGVQEEGPVNEYMNRHKCDLSSRTRARLCTHVLPTPDGHMLDRP